MRMGIEQGGRMMENRVITISREYGSGGRMIGRKLAEKLGIHCYDADLIQRIVDKSGYSADFVKEEGESAAGGVFSTFLAARPGPAGAGGGPTRTRAAAWSAGRGLGAGRGRAGGRPAAPRGTVSGAGGRGGLAAAAGRAGRGARGARGRGRPRKGEGPGGGRGGGRKGGAEGCYIWIISGLGGGSEKKSVCRGDSDMGKGLHPAGCKKYPRGKKGAGGNRAVSLERK